MPDLLEIVAYRRDVLTQFLLVATVLAAFSASGLFGVAAAPTPTPAASRLRTFLFVMLTVASLIFIFATTLAALVLPSLGRITITKDPTPLPDLEALSRLVVLGVGLGCLALVVAIGGLGFMLSRLMGVFTATLAGLATLLLIACAAFLANALR